MPKAVSEGGFSPEINDDPHSIEYNGIRIPWAVLAYNVKPENAVRYLLAKFNKTDKEYKLSTDVNTQALIDDLMAEKDFISPYGESIDHESTNGQIELYCYDNGVYKANGNHTIKTFCYGKLKSLVMKKHFDIIADYIKSYKRKPMEEMNTQHILTMSDCNYNWMTKKAEPHSPDVHNTISIPVRWDNPDADVKPFQDFLEKVMLPNEIQAMYELIGYCLCYGDMTIRELFVFYSSQPACGKTVCANVITELIGERNTNNATLSELVEKRFSSSMIIGKMINVCPEEEQGKLPTGKLKSLTGQDRTNSERKGKDEIASDTTAKFIVLSNHLPSFKTSEESIFTRINVFSFPNSFKDNEDKELTDKLSTPDVLSGILHKAIKAYHELEERGRFSNWKPIETREMMVHTVSNSLRAFVEIFVERGDFDDELTKHELHVIYSDNFCKIVGSEAKVIPKVTCGKLLPKVLDYVDDGKREKNAMEKTQERIWRFLKWKDPEMIKASMHNLLKSMGKRLPEGWEPLVIKNNPIVPPKPKPNINDYEGVDDYAGRFET